VSFIQSSTNELFQTPHLEHLFNRLNHCRCSVFVSFPPDSGWKILHSNPLQTIIKGIVNIIERPVAKLVKFIDPHQSVFLVLILIDESSRVRICRISLTSLQIRSVRVGPRQVELLLVAFNSQLKVFHAPLDDNAPGEHSQGDVKCKTLLDS
nr:hypothetical protein [Tanacetum cinerariifolium]